MLRLNMGIAPTAEPERLGVLAGDNAGYPNGRRLADDVIDIALMAVEGALLMPDEERAAVIASLQDGVDGNDVGFGASFPYVALPHDAPVNRS